MISERIKTEREALGLSQQALAERLGISLRSQQNYEKGDRSPDSEYLAAMAAAGADVLFILTGEPTPVIPTPDPGELLLVTNYRECTAEDKAALIRDSTLYAARIKKPAKAQPEKVIKASVKRSLFGSAIGSISIKK